MFRNLFARLLTVLGVFLLASLALATPAAAAPTVHVVTSDGVAVAFTLDPAAVVQLVVAFCEKPPRKPTRSPQRPDHHISAVR